MVEQSNPVPEELISREEQVPSGSFIPANWSHFCTLFVLLFTLSFATCEVSSSEPSSEDATSTLIPTITEGVSLVVLGNVQDGGSPHIGCEKDCCAPALAATLKGTPLPAAYENRMVVALGLIDAAAERSFLFEATPNLSEQWELLKRLHPAGKDPNGIFLTHAHIGHYAGLMFLGREALGAKEVPVFAMPRMKEFLETNGPWSQLVELGNIELISTFDSMRLQLGVGLSVTPFRVPHRDEFSETVGFLIDGPDKSAVFIPDINKWEKWSTPIEEVIASVDYAFLDATFYAAAELNNRDMAEIPHPFIVESMERLQALPPEEKDKVYFIHLNHSNPALDPDSEASEKINAAGFHVARYLDRFAL